MGEWISVKDRLPELFKDVLTCDVDGKIIINWLDELEVDGKITINWLDELEEDICYFAYAGKTVTHWMPLPEPPEEEEGE